jgi:hypothetical protein
VEDNRLHIGNLPRDHIGQPLGRRLVALTPLISSNVGRTIAASVAARVLANRRSLLDVALDPPQADKPR